MNVERHSKQGGTAGFVEISIGAPFKHDNDVCMRMCPSGADGFSQPRHNYVNLKTGHTGFLPSNYRVRLVSARVTYT